MTQQPTHTHREAGGKFHEIAQHQGTGPLEGQWLVIFLDLIDGIQSATTQADWVQNWREIAPDDCTVCMGTGFDHIKNNKEMPCGGCYGLGKVLETGEAPKEMWELATVATTIITRQEHELRSLRRIAQNPAVQALIEQQRQHAIDESTARQEQEWRRGKGHGPHGQRHTGD
ncbi:MULTISPECIES: hypothetical protein [Halomonadaceae]|uniref:Uncharacterized protein n=1 Tax=Vreelandella titanicae TaxID=664683 RepID=A0AAP9NLQ0_9GAMM|nr:MULTISPECIES: hypothetical protein [Halomonas]QKS24232.1 hypothetical protein FX987_02006 [Halomonas titanicae]CDG54524.1 conserved hypothetical protein [Halomonas sp. A3H3]SDI31327.1 hypothetical protein SAMN04487867_104226 [Halomonas titanicae]